MSTYRSYILKTNLQLSAAGLFKYVWPFSRHQALKEMTNFAKNSTINVWQGPKYTSVMYLAEVINMRLSVRSN